MEHTVQSIYLAHDGREAALTSKFADNVHPAFSIRLIVSIFAWNVRGCAEKEKIMQAFANLRVATKPLSL
jgi:hypothetical protein